VKLAQFSTGSSIALTASTRQRDTVGWVPLYEDIDGNGLSTFATHSSIANRCRSRVAYRKCKGIKNYSSTFARPATTGNQSYERETADLRVECRLKWFCNKGSVSQGCSQRRLSSDEPAFTKEFSPTGPRSVTALAARKNFSENACCLEYVHRGKFLVTKIAASPK